MLGLSLYTQALTRECVHTKDTKWKESAFYANTSLSSILSLDEIIFFSDNEEENMPHVCRVLKHLGEA